MKRFNTDRIRQRMRENNERFPHSKGKLLSSAPIRILIPPQTDKENFVPVSNNANGLNGPNNTHNDDMKTDKIPQLSIAVTMSEADDDKGSYTASIARYESSRFSDNEDSNTVPSVWAMMEHYQGDSKNNTSDDQTMSKTPVRISENDSYEASNHHLMLVSLGSDSPSTDVSDHKVIESGVKSKKVSEENGDVMTNNSSRIPSRIHWLEDEGSEFMQSPFYAQEASEIGINEELEISNDHGTDLSTANEDNKHDIFRRDTASYVSDQAVSPICASQSKDHQDQPTPARFQQEWVDSGEDADSSTHPDPLFKDSMVQSIQMASDEDSNAADDDPSNIFANQIHNDSNTQFTLESLAESKNVSEFEGNVSADSSTITTQEVTRPNLQIQTQELDDDYFDRLGELESSLKDQKNNTDQTQSRLQERVMELEQALKMTVATPRGTVVDENPLKILLNRNQTLVKEVRFADQTCVELSSKISELEMRNQRLQKRFAVLEEEKSSLQSIMDEKEVFRSKEILEKETTIEKLEIELSLANESLRTKTAEEENLRHVLCQAAGDLSFNDDAPSLSLAASIISERDSITQDHSIDSNSFQLPKTIQQQIGILVERAKSSILNTEEMGNETDELRNENIALKKKLNQLRVDTGSVPIKDPTEDTNEILKIQKENEFLGRQLGIVQEKLDQTQHKLNDEYQKSGILRIHLERSLEKYNKLIEPLERRLIEVTKCNPKLRDIADVDKSLLELEKELVNIKSSIVTMKCESEHLCNTPAFNIGAISNIDQDQQIISLVHSTISRMRQKYKQLEVDVERMTVGLSERLNSLTATISLLRSSLLFEKESVCTEGSNKQEAEENLGLNPNDEQEYCESSIDFMNATIPVQQHTEVEDEIYKVMEEARSPRKHEISISSELDDISRLLNDDITLGSNMKAGSVNTSTSNLDMFNECLEAAVNECKRVRERTMKLKEDIESQKLTIQKLEQENGKLSLNATRRSEEFCLVERAMGEAKEEINDLRNISNSSQNEKEILYRQLKTKENEGKLTKEENERLKKSIVEVQKQKHTLEVRISNYESSLAKTKIELESVAYSDDEYKKRFKDLQSHLSTKIQKATEQKELESAETRRALQVAFRENSDLKRFHQDALKRLSQEVESKSKLESQINELHHFKLQAQSDLEDKDLESKFAFEDMRKERAELKYKLSQTEKETASLKESYSNYKAKMEEKRRVMEKTKAQRLDLLSKVKLMAEKRTSFVNLLEKLGCCEALIPILNSEDFNSDKLCPFESMMKEIDCWECVIPLIGDEIETFHHALATIFKFEMEIETLNNDLLKHEIRESDQLEQAVDQTSQNEKLFDLLRQAEGEMERSALQIKEMSETMAGMQQCEKESNKNNKLLESELMKLKNESEISELEKKQELMKVKHLLLDTSSTLEKKDTRIMELNSQMNSTRSEIDEVTSILRSKESEEHSLKVNLQSYEKKNSRLREYIRKLTTKCEEWEASYDSQSRAIDRLQEKKARIKEKACDIAGRYRALVSDINRRKKLHQDDREKWSHERSNLNSVHAALEEELEQISKELA